ncbi:unnamed protein product [Adineta steineri]|uniref:Uncharacterized protein n=1 Tax=Adineta steineri TaxID=433720 RepID=A0A814N7B6_9BILA|nr:unnamed protein product [Adineta steineri]CAF1089398.1 unnamed protein product [Adineta steineri]
MLKKSNENISSNEQIFENEKEKLITNSHKNRSFINNILKSNDEHAIKKLFEEYFYLHAKNNNHDRITWDELRFIINEILQRNNDELILSEASKLFYQMYQLQYNSTVSSKNEMKQLSPKRIKSEQELLKSKNENKK